MGNPKSRPAMPPERRISSLSAACASDDEFPEESDMRGPQSAQDLNIGFVEGRLQSSSKSKPCAPISRHTSSTTLALDCGPLARDPPQDRAPSKRHPPALPSAHHAAVPLPAPRRQAPDGGHLTGARDDLQHGLRACGDAIDRAVPAEEAAVPRVCKARSNIEM